MHSSSFFLTKAENTEKIVNNIVQTVAAHCPDLLNTAEAIKQKYEPLFKLFAACHFAYNGSKPMEDDQIITLGTVYKYIYKLIISKKANLNCTELKIVSQK